MARSPVMNFMKQQGFTQEPPDRAALRFKGLQFQPTLVGSMMLVGILTQSPAIFLLVSAILWLNVRSEEHTSELQSRLHLVCRLLLEKKKMNPVIEDGWEAVGVPAPRHALVARPSALEFSSGRARPDSPSGLHDAHARVVQCQRPRGR